MEKEELNNKTHELSDNGLETTNGGCGNYDGKPGTHFIDDYGTCHSCVHDHNGKCDLEQ
ncbi:MAG: hypothetical protein KBT35_07310 [Firmicutes bacterium]|nr:hypothetical protein [Candidatus Colivicinus equi]